MSNCLIHKCLCSQCLLMLLIGQQYIKFTGLGLNRQFSLTDFVKSHKKSTFLNSEASLSENWRFQPKPVCTRVLPGPVSTLLIFFYFDSSDVASLVMTKRFICPIFRNHAKKQRSAKQSLQVRKCVRLRGDLSPLQVLD